MKIKLIRMISYLYETLNKTIEILSMIIVFSTIFHENNKNYPLI